jgi:16S rRNA (guanine527-N7)-methyltransferase
LRAGPPAGAATDAELAAILGRGAGGLDLALTGGERDLFVAYIRLIERWNAAYNLTAVRDPRAMAVQHVLDCLAVINPLRRRALVGAGRRILDVGSGAGLPGLVIAAMQPAVEVVCVDSVGKKAAFITDAASRLGLRNASAHHGRVESMIALPFDVITSRAFASLQDFLSATRHLLADGGVWMAMKGKSPASELAALSQATFHVEPLQIPGSDSERCIVWASQE